METPNEGSFDPKAQGSLIKKDMEQFQGQVALLRQQAETARQKTLLSIKDGIQKATQEGLHQVLFPGSQNPIAMPKNKNQNQQKAQPIASGQNALEYTDQHLSDLLNKVHTGVDSAMNQALKATSQAQQGAAASVSTATQAAATAETTSASQVESALEASAKTVEEVMAKAQNTVAGTLSQDQETKSTDQQGGDANVYA